MAHRRAFCLITLIPAFVLLCQPFDSNGIEIAAIGRVAQLGEFYDATEEKFLNQLIFSQRLPPDLGLVNMVQTPHTETKFQVVNTLSEKIDFLGISASMAVSLKCSSFTIDVNGRASYVNEEKKSAKFAEGFLLHKTQTVKETVDLFYQGIRQYVDTMGLMETIATHVVTGIYYGADVTAKFTDTNQNSSDLQDIKGKLEVEFKMEQITVKGAAEVNITNSNFSNSSKYDLQISGDIPMNTIPRNVYEVIEFIKDVSNLLVGVNEGKGKPILYILTPLGELQDAYALEHMNAKIVQTIDGGVLNQILEVFEEISKTRQRLNDLQEDFNIYTETCMSPSLKKTLDELSNAFDTRGGSFRSEIRAGLVGVRSGNASFNLQHIIGNYTDDPNSFEKVNGRLDSEFDDGRRKIQFYEAFRKHDVTYLTESAYEADLINTNHTIFYVLFYNLSLVDSDTVAWDDATNLFLTHLKRDWTKLKVVDCDFPLGNSYCSSLTKSVIHGFVKNRRVSSDVVRDYSHYNRTTPIRLPAMENENPFEPEKLYEIGQMFNWRKGQFLDSFLLKEKPLSNTSTSEKMQSLRCEIVSSTWKDTFLALNVPPMLQVPILSRQVSLLGSGQVFASEKDASVDRLHLVCEKRSQKYSVDVDTEKMVKSLDLLSLIDNTDGSHFVQAMEYAAVSIVSLEAERSNGSTQEVRKMLNTLKVALENQDKNKTSATNRRIDLDRYELQIFSDVFPQSQPVAKTLDEVKQVFQSIHDIFAEDVTKGTAVYTLHPISSLQLEYGIISQPRSINPAVSFNGILEFAGMFDKLPSLEKLVDDKVTLLRKYEECTQDRDREEMKNLTNSFKAKLTAWHGNLKSSFASFHETGKTVELEGSLKNFTELYADGEAVSQALAGIIEGMKNAIEFYDELRERADGYVSSKKLWRESFYKAVDARAYFLVFNLDWLGSANTTAWKETVEFFKTIYNPSNSTYGTFLLDCSFFGEEFVACRNVSQIVIHEYKDGQLHSDDYLQKFKDGGEQLTQLERLELDIQKHNKESDGKFADCREKYTAARTTLANFKATIQETLKELDGKISGGAGVPPLGFVYNKYVGTEDPAKLWGTTPWTDISANYPGVKSGTLMRRD